MNLDLTTFQGNGVLASIVAPFVALGWLFGRGHVADLWRYVRRLEWALTMAEARLIGYRRGTERIAAIMSGRATVPNPALTMQPDPYEFDHSLRRPAGRVYESRQIGWDDTHTIVQGVVAVLDEPARPTVPDEDGLQRLPFLGELRTPAAIRRRLQACRTRIAEGRESRGPDRSLGWLAPGAMSLLRKAKTGRHRSDEVAVLQPAHTPRHVRYVPMTVPYPLRRSCTP